MKIKKENNLYRDKMNIQSKLCDRLQSVMVLDPDKKPVYKLPEDMGVSLSCLRDFINCSRITSYVQLLKIECYIIKKEKEFGIYKGPN